MRAISVKQPYAEAIAAGAKRIEYRSRRIELGPLLILSSKAVERGGEHLPRSVGVCVVDVVKIGGSEGRYRWYLEGARRVMPFAARSFGWIVHVPTRTIRFA